jgi:exopolyphosphatase/guanosine-5'-triphosphate,3'-diphosphate pyrophosphatase
MSLWASVDLGTNTFRLLIAEEVAEGKLEFRELHQEVVRLGEGLAASGRFQLAALHRARTLLERFRSRMEELGVDGRVGSLTAAGREALDGDAFRAEASALLGAHIRVLSGEEEARLSAKGARSLVDAGRRDFLFLDIGGGSTEVVSQRRGLEEVVLSLPTGVVKLHEALDPGDPPTPADLSRLETAARDVWTPVLSRIGGSDWQRAFRGGRALLAATAGTPLTIAAQVMGRDVADTRSLNGVRVSREDLDAVWDRFRRLTRTERAALAAVEKGREDVILPGIALLRAFVSAFGAPAFTVTDGGLLEGVLLEAVEREHGGAAWVC